LEHQAPDKELRAVVSEHRVLGLEILVLELEHPEQDKVDQVVALEHRVLGLATQAQVRAVLMGIHPPLEQEQANNYYPPRCYFF